HTPRICPLALHDALPISRNAAREADPLGGAELVAAGYEVDPDTGRATTIEGLQHQYFSRPEVYRKGKYDHFFPSASAKYAFNDRDRKSTRLNSSHVKISY